MPARFKRAEPYADDAMNLPVGDVAAALPFYENTLKFRVVSRGEAPVPSAVLARDDVRIRLAENGGDPTQEGCFFEVDDVEAAYQEVHGAKPDVASLRVVSHAGRSYRVFFVVAPDGLCYMVGVPIMDGQGNPA